MMKRTVVFTDCTLIKFVFPTHRNKSIWRMVSKYCKKNDVRVVYVINE